MIGVNLAGADFGPTRGVYGTAYIYPGEEQLDYYHSKGIDLVRLPFKWERMQPSLNGPLNQAELARLETFLQQADERGMQVVLDLHNFGRYDGRPIGSPGVSISAFQDFWTKLAAAVVEHGNIAGYGIMNEPHDMPGSHVWPAAAQAAVNGIRQVDQTTTIIVGGDSWSGAPQWKSANANLLVDDPADNVVYEAHVYFDRANRGVYEGDYDEEDAYPTIGVDRVRPFLEWLEENNVRGFIGEYAVPDDDPRWLPVLSNFLAELKEHDVSSTYWAGGPWWGDYRLAIEPRGGHDRPQLDTLLDHITPGDDEPFPGQDHAPVLAQPIADQTVVGETDWSFQIPAGTFTDADGDALSLIASLADGSTLPSWLSFDAATRTFGGTPPHHVSGEIVLKVSASDGSASVSDTFGLTITAGDGPGGQPQPPLWSSVVDSPRRFSDLDGDGCADVVWRNDNGAVAVWRMDGAAITSTAFLPGVSHDWTSTGVGDFNADGMSDMLWQNDDGRVLAWMMDSSVAFGQIQNLGSRPADMAFAGLADVNGDGKTDLLWRDPTDGTVTIHHTGASQTSIEGVEMEWAITGFGDFNADGAEDVLFRNVTDGVVASWLMDSDGQPSTVFLGGVGQDWHINGTGDFNGDGTADVFWRNDNGSTAIWQMNGGAVQSTIFLDGVGHDWRVIGTGDVGGDGRDDIIWRNDNGATAIWQMNGGHQPVVDFPGGVPNDWHTAIQSNNGLV